MATLYGVNRTKLNTPIGANVIREGQIEAKEGIMYDTYEAAGTTADDVVLMGGLLPSGSIVTSITLVCDDLGTGVTADVGDGDTIDRYLDGVDVASAASINTFPNVAEIDNLGYQTGAASGDTQIQVALLGAAATGTIKLLVKYSL